MSLLGARRQPRLKRVRASVESFLASGDLDYERNFLIVRPAIALVVILAAFVSGGIPGRTGLLLGCSSAVVYNFGLAYLVFARRMYLLRAASLLCDNLVIIATSLHIFAEMGRVGYESDLWLIYITLIVTNAMYYGPLGSMFFTALWTGLFIGVTLGYYDRDSYAVAELPVRLTFFILTGFCSISLSAELRKRHRKLEKQGRQTLSMLAAIVEARDTDAGQHLGHVTHYSRAIALRLGMDDKAANEIAYAAMIHDVGKAQVPDAILKKPGPLTPDERREIEKHTVWGYDLLADNDEFSSACEVARSHHERWDGTGYPDGLAGEAIPLAARITAVADVYDALTSERPYKRAWPAHDAIAEIKRMRGAHLDPTIVDVFLDLYERGVLHALDEGMREDTRHDSDIGLAA